MKTAALAVTSALAVSLSFGAVAQTPAPAVPIAAPAAPATLPGSPITLLETVRSALTLHPSIAQARVSVDRAEARLERARGPFDPTILADVTHTHDTSPVLAGQRFVPGQGALVTDTTALDVGGTVGTTWGMGITPSVGLARTHLRDQNGTVVPGIYSDPYNTARVGLAVTQHLMRGAGTVGAASELTAARLGKDASVSQLARATEERAYVAITAYFELVAAVEELALLRAARGGSERVLADTKVLVEGNQRPRSDLRQLEGNLSNRNRQVMEAENTVVQARYGLCLAMGLSERELRDFVPADGFPAPGAIDLDRNAAVRRAAQTRTDVQAARASVASTAAALRGADWNTRPAVDLNGSIGYAGLLGKDGVGPFFASAGRNVAGVNAGVGLSLELPLANSAREAERDSRRADFTEAMIAERDLDRTYPLAVASALDELRLSRAALAESTHAVEQYTLAVQDQRDKLREGAGTVIDTVFVEELLTNAALGQTANRLRAADAAARVLLETGALPNADKNVAQALGPLVGASMAQGAVNGGQ